MPGRRDLLGALAAGLLTGPPATAAAAAAAEPVTATLRLKWLPQAQFAGFYLADTNGYYRDAGIDLTIRPGGPNLLAENLAASGADTIGISGGIDSVLVARNAGLPVICIGVVQQLTPFVFVARADGPIKTLRDFQGKTVTTWFIGADHVLTAMLVKAGVDPASVNIQAQQVSIAAFIDGQVDVVTASRYNEYDTLRARLGDAKLRRFVAEDYGVSFPGDTLVVSAATLKEHPALAKGFLRASIRGWKAAFADPSAAIDAVMAIAPNLDRSHQEFQLAEIKRLMLAGKVADNGLLWIDMDTVKATQALFLKAKVISKPVDLATAFTNDILAAIPLAERKP
jgi:NitT/TauT family transport system substrate-binding protein